MERTLQVALLHHSHQRMSSDGQGYPRVGDASFGNGPRERSTGTFSSFRAFLPGMMQELLPARSCLPSLPESHPRHCYHLARRKTNHYFTEKTLAIPVSLGPPKTESGGPAHPSAGSHRTPRFECVWILRPVGDRREEEGGVQGCLGLLLFFKDLYSQVWSCL